MKCFIIVFCLFQVGAACGKLKNFIIEPFVAHAQVGAGELLTAQIFKTTHVIIMCEKQ